VTTAFTPEPDPANPAVPQYNPVLPGLHQPQPATNAANPPDADRPRHDAPDADPPDSPSADDSPDHPGGDIPASPQQQPDQPDPFADPASYTTTEPGFPIGELIAGLVQPPLSAAMTLPAMAMGLPSAALGIAGPLLSSMLALLGEPHSQPHPNHAAPPPPRTPDPVTASRGPAMDRYHDQAQRLQGAETDVKDSDKMAADAVAQGNVVHHDVTGQMHAIAARINAAAARTPPGPEAAAGLENQIRAAVADARTAITSAQGDYQRLATHLTTP
jgi:hypothetical protein